MRELLAPTGWGDRTRSFAKSLRKSRLGRSPGGLLLVGTPTHEPWHLTAHLDDEARWFDLPEITPTLVRWQPPAEAPPHLSIGLKRLEQVERGETVMVVAPDRATEPLLERVADARRSGAVVLSLDAGDKGVGSIGREARVGPGDAEQDLLVPGNASVPPMSFDLVPHLVSGAPGDPI